MNGIDPVQLSELEGAVRSDPGARVFPALAEAYRQAGRASDAEQVARRGLERSPDTDEGRLVLALALLDQDREDEARRQLSQLVSDRLAAVGLSLEKRAADAADAGPASAVSDAELEIAFRQAETDAERLITPNRVAEEALAHVDAGAAEGLDESVLEPGSAFATATMADLLARQGDARGAERIRRSLEARTSPSPSGPHASSRERRIATLERWLANIRGGRS